MVDALDGGMKDKDKDKQHEALFDAIATVLALAFMMWLPAQQVMLVHGQGADADVRAAVRAGRAGDGAATTSRRPAT